ncbi:MAG: glycosyltransferase family 39 protein [Patescibacteria group bacterium]|nr:glycosyltransferase family 39 protein [Patescibacteria group bacterium]MCL5431579.1 glycosyltransferase family 39 protein [Patescibacteria group bacterium]
MWLRILLGFPAVYFLSGFPLARLFLPQEKTFSLKLLLTSFAFSCFLTYPAAVLTTMIEGQSAAAIYSVHLPHSLLSLAIISLPFWFLLWKKRLPRLHLPSLRKVHLLLALFLILYSLFVFVNLNRADVLGDDYDLGYQAYNLQDGILDARRAYVISFNTHPPLMMTIKHYGMQLFYPWGLDGLSDWMFRGVEGMMGLGVILTSYLLVRDFFSERTALLTAALLAVNNYLIFMGRIFLREIYLTFFLVIALYFFLHKRVFLAAFFLGCALLVKASAVILLPVFILWLLKEKRVKELAVVFSTLIAVYAPVVVYNVGAYLVTGHMDATFSWLFHLPNPFLTGQSANPLLTNPSAIISILTDLYGWPVFAFFLLCLVIFLFQRRHQYLLVWLVSSLIFFCLGPLREYYLLPLTIPLVIILADVFKKLPILIVSILIFSAVYSFSSDSAIVRAYSADRGWKNLSANLSKVYLPGDCLIAGQGVSDLPLRRYLKTDDGVKTYLLGPNYPHYYKMCTEVKDPEREIVITYNNIGKVTYEVY